MRRMTTRTGLVKKEKESLEKSLLQRIDTFERNFFDVFVQLQAYVRKIARTRDEADVLTKTLLKFAESETISKSFRSGISSFACHFSAVQDYRHAEVERLEKRVIAEMTAYGDACKTVRDSIRKIFTAKESESSSKTFASALPQLHALQVDRFEEKKLSDLKRLFCEMAKIEMLFHAKSIEMLTRAFNAVSSINEREDLSEFRRVFKLHALLPSNDAQQADNSSLMQSSLSSLSLSKEENAMPADSQEEETNSSASEEEEVTGAEKRGQGKVVGRV